MLSVELFLIFSAALLTIAVLGMVINRKNLIVFLMCIELMLLSANLNFIGFSWYHGDITGAVFVFFTLTVAAAEAAIGLAILVLLYRARHSINVDDMAKLKG